MTVTLVRRSHRYNSEVSWNNCYFGKSISDIQVNTNEDTRLQMARGPATGAVRI